MLYISLIVIIIISLVIIGYILASKLFQVSNLDLTDLEEEKVQKKKKEIIMRKVDQESGKVQKKFLGSLKPIGRMWADFQLKFRIYVGKIQQLWHHEQVAKNKDAVDKNPEDRESKLDELIQQGERSIEDQDYEKAENAFITAISIDNKAAAAYRGLGDTYLAKNELEEARQTYIFLTRLEKDDDNVLVKLAEIAESQGDIEEAIGYFQKAVIINPSLSTRFYHLTELLLKIEQPDVAIEAISQAVELEPQNPKYLDLLIENAIICGDKDLAKQALDKLRMVNPDNNKLDVFRQRIYTIK